MSIFTSLKHCRAFILVSLFCAAATGCSTCRGYKETRLFLHTFVTIHVIADNQVDVKTAFDECWEEMAWIDKHCNAYSREGELFAINASGAKKIAISRKMQRLIGECKDVSEKTGGLFDITVFPLVRLWEEGEKNKKIPTQGEIDSALFYVGCEKITLFPQEGFLQMPKGMKLDFGAAAKGFALSRLESVLMRHDINHYLIEAGGDIVARGMKKNVAWQVGINDPRLPGMIGALPLKNKAVATSGNYNNYFAINGQKYSHIINPITGFPAKKAMQVTILADDPMLADCLATACSLLSWKEIEQFAASYENKFECMAVFLENGAPVLKMTRGFETLLDQSPAAW